jgi:hypothetical protein
MRRIDRNFYFFGHFSYPCLLSLLAKHTFC